jgi:hypothetical protein
MYLVFPGCGVPDSGRCRNNKVLLGCIEAPGITRGSEVALEIDVRSWYGHILLMVLVAGPGTRRYMLWISRADPGPSLITLVSN